MIQGIWLAWLQLGLSAIGTCAGNLLLKQANLSLSSSDLLVLVTSPWFVAAIACYIFDLVLFTQALQPLAVSAAVPVASGIRIGATTILAHIFFDEHLTVNQLAASSLIIAGIVTISRA